MVSIPDGLDWIQANRGVGRDQRQPLFDRLADQQSASVGSKKDGWMATLPSARPRGRLALATDFTGRNSATGVLRRQIVTVSPASTRARYSERCAFASWMFTEIMVRFVTNYMTKMEG